MRLWSKFVSMAVILAAVSTVHAQQDNGPPGGGDPNGGGMGGPGGDNGGPPDPQQMQAMMDKRIKSALEMTDDAWATLQPLVEKVQQLEHNLDSGPRLHGRPRRDDDDNGEGQREGPPQSSIDVAVANLKKVLDDKSSSDQKIEDSMKAVEDSEKKTREELADAQKQLKAAVNLRQQAVLTALGVLN